MQGDLTQSPQCPSLIGRSRVVAAEIERFSGEPNRIFDARVAGLLRAREK